MSAPTTTAPTTSCASCGEAMARQTHRGQGVRVHGSHGLCVTCESRARRDGTLADYPRVTRPTIDTVEDYRALTESGQCRTRAAAAAAMGMSLDALDRALYRAGLVVAAVPRTESRAAGWGRR